VKESRVSRPKGKAEYSIFFATNQATKGWADLLATRRNDLIEAWEFLTANPLRRTPLSYPLQEKLALVKRSGEEHSLWQLKLSKTHGARIWYYVTDGKVMIEAVHTAHPNQTK
jgi:hypothetical protein